MSWHDCPFNKINDPFPGECGRYIDVNQDNFCDHSQISKNSFGFNYLIAIVTVLVILYIFSVKYLKNYKKIWNWVLLISFTLTAITGWFWHFLHLPAGVITLVIGLFHCLWHWSYFFSRQPRPLS